MKSYHFTIEYKDYSARLVMVGEWSLFDLAETCIEAVEFEFDHAFEFCADLRYPHRGQECYSLFSDMDEGEGVDEGPGVKRTLISSVFTPGKQMVLHFDFGDDWFFLVSCTANADAIAPPKRRLRKVLSRSGTPPEQYPVFDD